MSGWPRASVLVGALALGAAGCSAVRYSADYDRQAPFPEYETYAWSTASPAERAALERVSPFLERRLQRAVDRELASRGFLRVPEDEADVLVSVHPLVSARAGRASGDSASEDAYADYRKPGTRVSVGVGIGFGRYGYPYFGYRYPYFAYYPYWGFGYTPYWGFGYPRYAFGYPYFGYRAWPAYPTYGAGYYSAGGIGRRYPRPVVPGTLVVDVLDARSDELVWRGWAEGALLEAPDADELDEYVDGLVAKILRSFPPPSEDRYRR